MRHRRRLSKLGIALLAVTACCIAAVVFIVLRLLYPAANENAPWNATQKPFEEVLLENVYIVGCSENKIAFLYQSEEYEMKGRLAEEYTGVADLKIRWNRVTEITAKPDCVKGTLLSYSDDRMTIREYGTLECVPELFVYSKMKERPEQIALSELILGSSNLKYVVADRKICALILEEDVPVTDIRVLLKKDGQIHRKELWMSGSGKLLVGDQPFEAEQIVNVKEIMDNNAISELDVTVEGGELFLCDSAEAVSDYGYSGSMHLIREEEGIVVINVLPIEKYVAGVIPSEMPGSFATEALKAQAICARTFAYDQMRGGAYAKYGANLDNTTAYQVYHAAQPTESTNQAVAATAGKVLLHDGELVTCYYFSTSPGVTETLEVWDRESPKYLKSVSTLAEKPGNLALETVFIEWIAAEPDSADSDSAFYRWNAELDLTGAKDSEYGKIKNVQVKQRSSAGYVLELAVNCEKGTRTLKKESEIRAYLGAYMKNLTLANGTQRSDLKTLPSACFCIEQNKKNGIKLRGGGFGHGIGMSQYGANRLAKEGYSCEKILTTYYQDVEIGYQ